MIFIGLVMAVDIISAELNIEGKSNSSGARELNDPRQSNLVHKFAEAVRA